MRPALLVLLLSVPGAIAPALAGNDSLRSLAANRDFHVGAAVAMTPFRADPAYREVLRREFNIIVAENAFKWEEIHIGRDTWYWDDADALVKFAADNGMAVRGHTLVWHNQLPPWLTSGTFSRDEAIAVLRDHIMKVVGRYKGKVIAWDVVNEAVADSGGSLRGESFWQKTIGPDYIELAFRFAREADPSAKLYYNDYNIESMNPKSDAVYALVKGLKEKGVPIDGVGWQAHLVNGFRIDDGHRQNADRLAALGLELSITELDVRTRVPADAAALDRQAKAYGDVAAFCLERPKCKALVSWGFTDRHSWIPQFFQGFGEALIFDEAYRPKPAYEAMHEAFESAPER